MNKKMILYIIGWVLKVMCPIMLMPCIPAILFQEDTLFAFIFPAILCLVVGSIISYKKPDNRKFYTHDGYITVVLVWFVLCSVGALPYLLSGEIPNLTNALFETVSGFTTTGSSILQNVEELSKSMLFWRSFSHWIGGMGVLIFVLLFLPSDEGSSIHIMRAESTGPVVGKLVPHIKKTAFILYIIYLFLTLSQMVILAIAGLPLFDAFCLSFATAGTGGFSIYNDSMISMPSYILNITSIFLLLFGINFSVYYLMLLRKFKEIIQLEELRHYFIFVLVSVILIILNTYHLFSNLYLTFTHGFFQVVSMITTTAFISADYQLWPIFCQTILLLLAIIGACSGSATGGFKISRFLILVRRAGNELSRYIHPNQIKKVKLNRKPMNQNQLNSVNIYLTLYICIFLGSVLLISLGNTKQGDYFSIVISSLSNTGTITSEGSYFFYNSFTKIILMFDMIAGRVELVPILLLFHPKTWKK